MKRKHSVKDALQPRVNEFRMMDAEMALAEKVGKWETIFRGATDVEIRKARMRDAIAGRAELFDSYAAVYGERP